MDELPPVRRRAGRARRRIGSILAAAGLTAWGTFLVSTPVGVAAPIARGARPQILARGTTIAGTSYTVAAEKGSGPFCRAHVTTAEIAPDGRFESGSCFMGRSEITMTCPGDRVAVEAILATAAREITLRLADGRTISSRVTRVPLRDGGPLGVYFQAVSDAAARPVWLIELDARGRRLGPRHNLQDHSSCKGSPGGGSQPPPHS
jgi:hypothetical protein